VTTACLPERTGNGKQVGLTFTLEMSCMASKTSSAFCHDLARAHCCMSEVKAAARGWKVEFAIALRTSPVPGEAWLMASLKLSMSTAGDIDRP
jgi:hypothetical protein